MTREARPPRGVARRDAVGDVLAGPWEVALV